MYGAEILINPHFTADQSAAAQGLLSKGVTESGHNPSLQATTVHIRLYLILPYPKGSESVGNPGSRQHPGRPPPRHTPCLSLDECQCSGKPHF